MASKVCFYLTATQLGGAERSVLDLASNLERYAGGTYTPRMVVPRSEGPLLDEFRKKNMPFTVLEMPARMLRMSRKKALRGLVDGLLAIPAIVIYIYRFIRLVKGEAPFVIHSNGIKCHIISSVTSLFHGSQVIIHMRDILGKGLSLLAIKLASYFDVVCFVANSKCTAQSLSMMKKQVTIIHNGLDPDVFKRSRNTYLHEKVGIDESAPIVGILGALARWKGQLEFIEMARRLSLKNDHAHFVIAGAEIYDTRAEKGFLLELMDMVTGHRLDSRIHMVGFEADQVRVLNSLDILVHASIKPEPFGRVVLEAMAVGVPVVAAAAGGILELIDDGINGFLYTPGDVGQMAEKVRILLADDELCRKTADSARKKFEEKFLLKKHVEAVISVYNQLAPGRV
ncbi:MAG: glycosyltransferase [Candidatus Poribacteria bacterium]